MLTTVRIVGIAVVTIANAITIAILTAAIMMPVAAALNPTMWLIIIAGPLGKPITVDPGMAVAVTVGAIVPIPRRPYVPVSRLRNDFVAQRRR